MVAQVSHPGSEINRRGFLHGAAAASAFLIAARTDQPLARAAGLDGKRRFAPVKVSRDRIIREVVGLRPYRPEGFVVDAERAGNKFLIHNYGHGGAGITLSWGTASLASDLAREFLGARTSALDEVPAERHADGLPFSVAGSTASQQRFFCNAVFRTGRGR